jgi:hypothetical protein
MWRASAHPRGMRARADNFGAHDGTTVPPKVLLSGERRRGAACIALHTPSVWRPREFGRFFDRFWRRARTPPTELCSAGTLRRYRPMLCLLLTFPTVAMTLRTLRKATPSSLAAKSSAPSAAAHVIRAFCPLLGAAGASRLSINLPR